VKPIAARTPDRTQTRVRTRDPERRSRILAAAEAAVGGVDHAIQIHRGNGLSAEYGLVPQWGLARQLRIAPVSREMILN
jgi:alkylation response protein AidB-like acyl-CoA dehydrogenase